MRATQTPPRDAASQHVTATSLLPLTRANAGRPGNVLQLRVSISSRLSIASASSRFAPHMLSLGRRLAHTAGRPGWPKIAQRKSGNSCTHRSPARLPCGIPGIGEEIDGAMQHAPQPLRQSIAPAFTSARPPQPLRGAGAQAPTGHHRPDDLAGGVTGACER